jgi:hypothetical protein
LALVWCLLVSEPAHADTLAFESVGLRGGFSGHSLFGENHPHGFQQHDVIATIGLPWKWYAVSGWGVSTKLIVSAGVLRSAGETNFIGTFLPAVAFGRQDEKITLTIGGGGALLSDYKWGNQNFGGTFQYVASVGVSSRIFGPVGIGYWLQHYSDAAMYGRGDSSRGADMHLFEVTYRY